MAKDKKNFFQGIDDEIIKLRKKRTLKKEKKQKQKIKKFDVDKWDDDFNQYDE